MLLERNLGSQKKKTSIFMSICFLPKKELQKCPFFGRKQIEREIQWWFFFLPPPSSSSDHGFQE
jgi:hypothetical protein